MKKIISVALIIANAIGFGHKIEKVFWTDYIKRENTFVEQGYWYDTEYENGYFDGYSDYSEPCDGGDIDMSEW